MQTKSQVPMANIVAERFTVELVDENEAVRIVVHAPECLR
jgi:hypothetical protein